MSDNAGEKPALPHDPSLFRFRFPVEVRFRDLDPMGHAHHAMPLIYLEEARAAYWRGVGGRSDLDGIDYVMAEVTVRYHARIEFPARLDVGLRTSRMGEKSFVQEFEVRSENGALLASGRTTQVMYDYTAGKSKPIDPGLRQRIEAFENGVLSQDPSQGERRSREVD
jgi:acyl-CoA thioester hydrolase